MQSNKANILKLFIRIIAGSISVAYLLSCFTPYMNPSGGFLWTILALGFPVLLVLMALVVVVSLFINSRVFLISILILLAGYKNINSCFAYHIFNASIYKGKKIKVLSWNVDGIFNVLHPLKPDKHRRQKLIDFITTTDADIVCMQDNSFCISNSKLTNDIKEMEQLGYPYHVLADDYISVRDNTEVYGTSIFSKYPIIGTSKVKYSGINYESLLYADVKIGINKIRVFTTHLRSMRLHKEIFYNTEDYTMVQEDTADILNQSVIHKLIYFDKRHAEQAIVAKQVMDTTKLPFIFCGDLNSVPSSFVYHHLSSGLNDVFLQKDWGFGSTYSEISPTLRIDVLLTSPGLTSINYFSPRLKLSDHYPVVATVGLP